jgi:agmatine deiminase
MNDSVITPRSLGYRMPAEWSRHSGTLLSWPANRETWPGVRLNRVEKVYGDIVETLCRYEPVHLLIPDITTELRMRRILKDRTINTANLIVHRIPTNDVWVRDCGPIMLKKAGSEIITDWGYNAWGGKYPPYDDDNRIP